MICMADCLNTALGPPDKSRPSTKKMDAAHDCRVIWELTVNAALVGLAPVNAAYTAMSRRTAPASSKPCGPTIVCHVSPYPETGTYKSLAAPLKHTTATHNRCAVGAVAVPVYVAKSDVSLME